MMPRVRYGIRHGWPADEAARPVTAMRHRRREKVLMLDRPRVLSLALLVAMGRDAAAVLRSVDGNRALAEQADQLLMIRQGHCLYSLPQGHRQTPVPNRRGDTILAQQLHRMLGPVGSVATAKILDGAILVTAPADAFGVFGIEREFLGHDYRPAAAVPDASGSRIRRTAIRIP